MFRNKNTIEMLGLKPEHYLYMTPVGEALIANADMFLSKRAVNSFGGYAAQQLQRLCCFSARGANQEQLEQHILDSIHRAEISFPERYDMPPDGAIKLYIDKSQHEDFDTEIFMDLNMKHYPLRDWSGMWNEMQTLARSYSKIGTRNAKAKAHNKLGKHQMHLLRIYMMAFDILERGQIITYREKEHKLLMDTRNGKYLTEDEQPTKEFMDIVKELDNKLNVTAQTSYLPDQPDMNRIQNFLAEVNYDIIMNGNEREFAIDTTR